MRLRRRSWPPELDEAVRAAAPGASAGSDDILAAVQLSDGRWVAGGRAALYLPAEPDDSRTEPDGLPAESGDPVAEPGDPTVEPDDLTVERDDPSAEPDDLTVEPDDPSAEPAGSSGQPAGLSRESGGTPQTSPGGDVPEPRRAVHTGSPEASTGDDDEPKPSGAADSGQQTADGRGRGIRRVGWERVERAGWDSEQSVLHVWETTSFGTPLRATDLSVEDPGRFGQLLRERISASVLIQRHVPLVGKLGVRVVGRRNPADPEANISWSFVLDKGLSPDQPGLVDKAEAALAAVRDELGV